MRILIVSSTVWNTDNSFGNTFSNLFEGMEDIEFLNVYCNYGIPKNNVNGTFYQITEKSLIKNLFNKNISSGKIVKTNSDTELNNFSKKGLDIVKQKRWTIFFWVRKVIWLLGRWKNQEFNNMILDFQPDIIFVPLYHPSYLNRIILYTKRISNAKLVTYALDDVYSLKRKSYSLFYWIERLLNIKLVYEVMNQSDLMYSVTEMQKQELIEDFNISSEILQKGIKNIEKNKKNKVKLTQTPLKMVYTGNIYLGRGETLSLVTRALEELNKNETKAELYIYTASNLDETTISTIVSKGNTFFMGSVSSEEVIEIQNEADILIHVESLDLKERLEVRHSLSTKIIDYLSRGKCIFAIGTKDIASIDYLLRSDVAIVASNKDDIKDKINYLFENKMLIQEYGNKALLFAENYHDINKVQEKLKNDLLKLSENTTIVE